MKRVFRAIWRLLTETFWLAVAAGIIAGGYFGFQYLGDTREVVEPAPIERPVALVQTANLSLLTTPLPIRSEGFVQPFRDLSLSAQSSGRIIELHPAILNRGTFREGEVLARLDDAAERASLARAQADIAATQARLDLNQTQLTRTQNLRSTGVVAQERVDELLSQEAELNATLESLRAALQSAEVALANKEVRAPFDGAVLTKSADVGSVVNAGQAIADIFTADRLEVSVPIREAEAALIPGLFTGSPAKATVEINFAGRVFAWDGTVTRFDPNLDAQTRTINVTVELNDVNAAQQIARNTADFASGPPPALINAFAKVSIEGAQPADTWSIPSTAFREGNVWVYENGTLAFAPAEVIHVDGEISYIQSASLSSETRVITSPLEAPALGMALREANPTDRRSAALDVPLAETAQ